MDTWLSILLQKHPRIFAGKEPSWSDLPEGWYRLLDALCTAIESSMTEDQLRDFRVTQVKEKFGGLRFYYCGGTDLTEGLVDSAEDRSEKICMECGEPGKRRFGGCVVTMCDFCTAEAALRAARRECR